MKFRVALPAVAAVLSLSPLMASASDADSMRACFDTFVAQNLSGRHASFAVESETGLELPLIAYGGTRTVKLVATEKSTGRVIATAMCKVKEGGKDGNVSIGSVDAS